MRRLIIVTAAMAIFLGTTAGFVGLTGGNASASPLTGGEVENVSSQAVPEFSVGHEFRASERAPQCGFWCAIVAGLVVAAITNPEKTHEISMNLIEVWVEATENWTPSPWG